MIHSGQGEVMEDRSEQTGHHLQAADRWDHRGEDLPQVRDYERKREIVRDCEGKIWEEWERRMIHSGQGEVVEDRSEQTGHHLQAADRWDH